MSKLHKIIFSAQDGIHEFSNMPSFKLHIFSTYKTPSPNSFIMRPVNQDGANAYEAGYFDQDHNIVWVGYYMKIYGDISKDELVTDQAFVNQMYKYFKSKGIKDESLANLFRKTYDDYFWEFLLIYMINAYEIKKEDFKPEAFEIFEQSPLYKRLHVDMNKQDN